MTVPTIPLIPVTDNNPARLSPTDVAQFIRLEQCERYLRLRLAERNLHGDFMRDYEVARQSIPSLLTRSGSEFEQHIEIDVRISGPAINFATDLDTTPDGAPQNQQLVDLTCSLAAGASLSVFQPRIAAQVGQWLLRGVADIIQLRRDNAGALHILIVDMKSSTSARVEHRLQVAFYREMLAAILVDAGVDAATIQLGILYRGPQHGDEAGTDDELQLRETQLAEAERVFGVSDALLELIPDPESYAGAVRDLVTGPDSTARRVAVTPFDALPYQLTYKCDGCLFNEFCMKATAETDDLSALPYMSVQDKTALQAKGIVTTHDLAVLKAPDAEGALKTDAAHEDTVRVLSTTWPVGPRLDELINRARRYRVWKGEPLELGKGSGRGYGTLPYADAEQNPNLVRVYIDAQHDYLQDRVYMVGSLIAACENGEPARRRSVVHLADAPPESTEQERTILLRWVEETMRAVVELAGPDSDGLPCAPIHIIFFNRFEQRLLLEALSRHFEHILAATPLYDFITQIAAFDSPVVTYLDEEIRTLKNYPMVCHSLQSVAGWLRFDWGEYREHFRTRLFDALGKWDNVPDGTSPWYTKRSRFNSQIPLEYAYAVWHDLPDPTPGKHDDLASYRATTPDLLRGFHARRLEAIERIAADFPGNRDTQKTAFSLPDLATFEQRANTLAQALQEFVTLERHAELSAWKTARLPSPERRVLAGETLLARYREEDQPRDVADQNRDNLRRYAMQQAWRAANPGMKADKKEHPEMSWDQKDTVLRLRLTGTGTDCTLDQALALSTLREGDGITMRKRWDVDSRLPPDQQRPLTPTPKQLLYGTRARIEAIRVDRDASQHAVAACVDVRFVGPMNSDNPAGFLFPGHAAPFEPGELYTIDPDPNDIFGFWCGKVVQALAAAERTDALVNPLYTRLARQETGEVAWPDEADAGQQCFLEGLDALAQHDPQFSFEPGKRAYIGEYGDAPVLLVQGPPGTGKSYSTAFALFARLQGAMRSGAHFRAVVSCKTHAATDVLLHDIVHVQDTLRAIQAGHPDLFRRYFDERLLHVPLFRVSPRGDVPAGVIPLRKKEQRDPGDPKPMDAIAAQAWCIVASTPGGTYGIVNERWNSKLLGHEVTHCLVLDEASQMNLPEAMMAGLTLRRDGQIIVVGDHRQMPPIVKHDWTGEQRRTFSSFRAYQSLFLALLALNPPMIKFEESFRLHRDMAEFLREEIYQQDGIPYFSRRDQGLQPAALAAPFVAAVLHPAHAITVVVHDELGSIMRNDTERDLMRPVLETLTASPYNLAPEHGLGVVVPHRAQRAALLQALPMLARTDPHTGSIRLSAVDTVERFQGDERQVILVSATESDPQYLLLSGEFLLDPRRLTVALSRAKRKMILVASRSVFSLFSADEETFANAQLWKDLLRKTCTIPLWDGERAGTQVQVWGNVPLPDAPH